jgi:hypothetical protein
MELWIELQGKCQDAYNKPEDDLIRRFYDYARWCWQSQIEESATCTGRWNCLKGLTNANKLSVRCDYLGFD